MVIIKASKDQQIFASFSVNTAKFGRNIILEHRWHNKEVPFLPSFNNFFTSISAAIVIGYESYPTRTLINK